MKKIGLIPNLSKDFDLETTKKLISVIIKNGCQAYIERKTAGALNGSGAVSASNIYSAVDFLVVMGGDGTILRAAKKAAVRKIPLMGINLGRLGYLTDVEKSGSEKALEKVLNGDYKSEKRMMLETLLSSSDPNYNKPLLALNDVCVYRNFKSKMIEFCIYINGEYIDRYRADGVIISSPTGSTAYNLSAGGPILKPDSEMIAITPICPHTLYARPFVVSSGDVITVELSGRGYGSISTDGQDIMKVRAKNVITIKKSHYYTTILRTSGLGFYDILRSKMVGEFIK